MKKLLADILYALMQEDQNIWVLTGGVGYGMLDSIRLDFAERFINCEASESAMVDMAVGLALSGKIPFVYAITPHLYRAFESIRIYLGHEKIAVKLIGGGRYKDYGNLGFSHWAQDDDLFKTVGLLCYWPEEKELEKTVKNAAYNFQPTYINIRR